MKRLYIVVLLAAMAVTAAAQTEEARKRRLERKQVPDQGIDVAEIHVSKGGVPLLKQIPILGFMFQRHGESLWYRLPDLGDHASDIGEPLVGEGRRSTALPFRERWMRQAVREKFPAVTAVDIVERSTRRFGEDKTSESTERGLEVFGPARVLPEVRTYLDGLAGSMTKHVHLEFCFVQGAPLIVRDGGPAVHVTVLDAPTYDTRMLHVKQSKKANIINAPELTLLNGQRGNLSILNQVSYIKDFDVEVVHGATVADPVIDVVQDGLVVDVAPVVANDGTIHLDVKVLISSLKRPIDEMTTQLATAGQKVTIQLPQVSMSQFDSEELVLRDGEVGFVITGLARLESDWKGAPIPVDVYCRVSVEDAPSVPEGTVVGIDKEAGLVFARWGEDVSRAARQFSFHRGNVHTGSGRVKEWHDRMAVLELTDGDPKVGDTVR